MLRLASAGGAAIVMRLSACELATQNNRTPADGALCRSLPVRIFAAVAVEIPVTCIIISAP
jgi:hypothetical protein